MDQTNTDQLSQIGLEVDQDVAQSLSETSRWTKFISVTVFIFAGLALLLALWAAQTIGSIMERMGGRYAAFSDMGALLPVIILVVVAIMVTAYYFLFNFSRKIKSALMMQNAEEMNAAFNSLKIFMIITTVITIISLLNTVYNLFKTPY